MAVTAQVQDALRIAVTITALPVLPAAGQPHPATPWTLYRFDGTTETPVRGAVDRRLITSSSTVVIDREAPLNTPIQYVLRYVSTANGSERHQSAWLQLDAPLPVVSDPITGDHVSLTIVEWPERSREGRGTVFDIAGRRTPTYVVAASMSGVSTGMVLKTFDDFTATQLEQLLVTGRSIHVRGSKYGVGQLYGWVSSFGTERVTNDADDQRRLHTLELLEVEAPDFAIAAAGDTLADLAVAVPTTLLALSQTWPTLLAIAQADLGGG